ncbi:hypothetical protein VEA_003211 [Vibrio antiquarius]|uniref:Uncharacterized protein n=1 Tax=Vibrio antiquarius (strain Ex25) TaxID=150340 RepID=A0ACA6QLR6_VIBAE|nr:hypothetical protein VEA_003211 [Vibrio antiquarius]
MKNAKRWESLLNALLGAYRLRHLGKDNLPFLASGNRYSGANPVYQLICSLQ